MTSFATKAGQKWVRLNTGNDMDALRQLLARCKCGVYLIVNEHRDYYDSPADRLKWYDELPSPPDIAADVRAKILETGNIVDLQFYPDTPIGSYQIVHWSLDAALQEALDTLANRH